MVPNTMTSANNNADILISLTNEDVITVDTAMQIPAVARCVNMIAGAAAMLPVRLYRRTAEGVEEITKDRRLDILNRDTGDTMNADYMRCAWVRDLLLTGCAYSYIEFSRGRADSLYYIRSTELTRYTDRTDPVHKVYSFNIGARNVEPWRMLKILHNTDGYGGGSGIIDENSELLGAAYALIKYQKKMMKTGGTKRGLLKTNGMKPNLIQELKAKWAALWNSQTDADTMIILNASDADFKELSSTSVDMQMNQTQETLDKEIMKLFGTSDGLLSEDTVRNAVMPVLDMMEAAFDSDLLTEAEKRDHYFAFDTRELTRGDIQQRFNAYATALSQNFMQLDEVRAMEDLPPLGINFIKLGLKDVLLDPQTGRIYTPNTNQYATMGENAEIPLTDSDDSGNIETEKRANKNHLPAGTPQGGQFASKAQQALFEALNNGTVSSKLNKDKQAKHKKGSKEYNDALAKGEFPSYTELSHMDVQSIINKNCGKGHVRIGKDGQFRETIELNQDFGYFGDEKTKTYKRTHRATIHYSKSGAHLVPSSPDVTGGN